MLLFACVFACTGCNVNEMSSLRAITRPYAAEYKCKRLQLGGDDLLGNYEYLKLDLRADGNYRFFWRDSSGAEDEYTGKYEMDEQTSRVRFSAPAGGEERSFEFPYEKGAVSIQLVFNEKLLVADFSAVE